MVDLGSGAKREIEDIILNRYACIVKFVSAEFRSKIENNVLISTTKN
jgi:hypothetical protein